MHVFVWFNPVTVALLCAVFFIFGYVMGRSAKRWFS